MTFMTSREKRLYHQIHPAKLATDLTAQIVSLVFFWRHNLVAGLLAMFLPPIAASALIIRFADLAWLKRSRLGRYIAWEMTPVMQAVRLAGTIPMVLGAWWRRPWLIALGLAVVLFGWLRGALFGR